MTSVPYLGVGGSVVLTTEALHFTVTAGLSVWISLCLAV